MDRNEYEIKNLQRKMTNASVREDHAKFLAIEAGGMGIILGAMGLAVPIVNNMGMSSAIGQEGYFIAAVSGLAYAALGAIGMWFEGRKMNGLVDQIVAVRAEQPGQER